MQDLVANESLVRGVLRHDEDAIERFVARMSCVPRILAAINARQGRPLDEDQLADLAQDTVLLVWRKLHQYVPTGRLESWAYGVAVREFQNARRRHLHARPRTLPLPADDGSELSAAPEQFEPFGDEIEQALGRLEPNDSEIIRMRHFDDESFKGIGAKLGMPMNTVKTRYHRGIERLREHLRVRLKREEHPR